MVVKTLNKHSRFVGKSQIPVRKWHKNNKNKKVVHYTILES